MSRMIKAELFRLKRNLSFWAIIILSVAFLVGFTLLGGDTTTVESFNSVIAGASSIVPLFTALIVIGLAQSDYSEGTMKNIVSSGISRTSIYLGKLITAYLATVLVFIIDGIVTVALAIYGGTTVSLDVVFVVKSILLQLVVLLNYTVIYFLLGSFIRSNALAISISYVYYFLGAFGIGMAANYLHVSGLVQYDLGVIATSVESVNVTTVSIMHLGVITIVILVVAIIGCLLFKKKDIK